MRELIISTSLVGSLIVFAFVINVPENLLMFILFGIVPGSNTVLSPLQMQQFWLVVLTVFGMSAFGSRLTHYLGIAKRSA